jgi:hypothetical protein
MSGLESESSSSSLRQAPQLKSELEYETWKPLMEQHCIELGLYHLLDMKLTRFSDMVKSRNKIESATHHLSDFGMEYIQPSIASVKQEKKDDVDDPFGGLNAERKKELVIHVKNIQKLYAVLNRSIPQSLRIQIGSEHVGNGCHLWQWLKETLQSTSTGMMNELLESIFSIRQQPGERFAAYKARVDSINDRLAINNYDLKEEQYTFVLLSRLTPEYHTISYTTKNDKTFVNDKNHVAKWLKLTKQMSDYESEYVKSVSDSSSGSAMSARVDSRSRNNRNGNRNKNRKHCDFCDMNGHNESECWKKHPHKNPNTTERAESAIVMDDQSSSSTLGFSLSAVATQSKLSYSDVACAGMRFTRSRPDVSSSSQNSPASSSPTTALKRLTRPNESKITSVLTGASSSSSTIPTSAKPVLAAASSSSSSSITSMATPSSTVKITPQPPAALSSASSASLKMSVSSSAPKVLVPQPAAASSSSSSSVERSKKLNSSKVYGPLERKFVQQKSPESKLAQSSWGVDSCASVHCTGNEKQLISKRRCAPLKIICADGKVVVAEYSGTVSLRLRTRSGKTITVKVHDVYYSPTLGANLLSLVKLCKDMNLTIGCDKEGAWLKENDKNGETCILKSSSNLIVIEGDVPAVVYAAVASRVIRTVDQLMNAHCLYAHMGVDRLIQYLCDDNTRGLGTLDMSADDIKIARQHILQCKACKLGKLTQSTYSKNASLNIGTAPGEVIHMDTFELKEPKYNFQSYAIVMSDPYSGALFCPIVQTKDKVAGAVIEVLKKIQTLIGNKVKLVHSDGGTEFLNHTLRSYCADNGITMTQSEARVPRHNGIAERYVRTIKDGTRTLLHHCGLDGRWAIRAIQHYLFIWNRVYVSSHTKVTPYKTYYKIEPSVNTVGIFGCDVYAWIHKDNRDAGTFAPRSEPGVYLGHDSEQNCPVVWLLKSGKSHRVRSVSYRNDRFKHAHALMTGTAAIEQVIASNDDMNSSSWVHSIDENESLVDSINVQSSEAVNELLPRELEGGFMNSTPSNDTSSSSSSASAIGKQYEIEKIVSHRPCTESSDGYEYRIKWLGYSSRQNTWNTSDTLIGSADDMYMAYRLQHELDTDTDSSLDEIQEGPSQQ